MSAGPALVEVTGRHWPLTLSTAEAAAFLGCSAQRLQTERGTGRLPVEPLTLGHRLRWPTLKIAGAVGLDARLVT